MEHFFKRSLATLVWVGACSLPAFAADSDGIRLDDSTRVAGQSLKLNGAGVSVRLVFKVYTIALYLQSTKRTSQDVLAAEGPRRVVIAMLRDVSGTDFAQAVNDFLSADADVAAKPRLAELTSRLDKALAGQAHGLRKGDMLTLDWIPGTGTVIELNQKQITAPMRDIAFYNALLNIWLGAKPADAALKTKLLGQNFQLPA